MTCELQRIKNKNMNGGEDCGVNKLHMRNNNDATLTLKLSQIEQVHKCKHVKRNLDRDQGESRN